MFTLQWRRRQLKFPKLKQLLRYVVDLYMLQRVYYYIIIIIGRHVNYIKHFNAEFNSKRGAFDSGG